MAMDTGSTSFAARRQATQALPPFHLPSTTQDIPSMSRPSHQFPFSYQSTPVQSQSSSWQAPTMIPPSVPASSSSATSNTQHSPNTASSGLTSPSGVTGEGLSPLSSGVNTTSSQSSQYYSGSWPTPQAHGSYQLSSGTPQSIAQQSPYASRSSTYEQQSPLAYSRTSQSPATGGEGLPAPSYNQSHQPFQNAYSQAGAGSTPVSLPSQAPQTAQPGILNSQTPVSTQPPTPGGVPSHVDSYMQSRPSAPQSYYAASSAPQQPGYHSYTSPNAPSPTTGAGPPRGLSSLHNPSGMAPPYQRYTYNVSPMGGPIMSNLGAPGHQMSLVPGMGVTGYGHHHLGASMYGAHGGQPNPQTERPFKCDQCPQSFNRNHDLKRHKRIHLAVKPFPCNFCDKSFSRKDALKRHRLVKGCGNKDTDASNENNRRSPPDNSDDGTPPVKRE